MTLLAVSSLTACATPAFEDAGCSTYFRYSKGLFGSEAGDTPEPVLRRGLALNAGMRAACDRD